MDIPHGVKCFPGYDKEEKALDADELRSRIFGEHVADYMRKLKDEGEDEKYTLQFGEYEKAGVEADDLEELYESVHEKIRADPSSFISTTTPSLRASRVTRMSSLSQRKGRIAQKKAWKEWRDNQGDEEAM